MNFAPQMKKLGGLGMAGLLALTTFAGATSPASAATVNPDAANKAVTWMRTQQQPDGSFAGFGAGSTVDAVLAIVADGQDPNTFQQGSNTPLTFLASKQADLVKTPGSAGKLLLAIAAADAGGKTTIDPKPVIDAINTAYDQASGHYGKDAIGHAFALLGLKAIGATPSSGLDYMKGSQTPEGGWAFTGDPKAGGSDTNTTAVVLQALIGIGETTNSPTITKALAYLATQQNADGGFPYQKGDPTTSESDVNSTSYVAQALIATGADASKPIEYLRSMQNPGGAFGYKMSDKADNAGATYQAVPAVVGATLLTPVTPSGVSGGKAAGGTNQGQTGTIQPGAVQPGMPSTGHSDEMPLAAISLLAAMLTGLGMLFRRRTAAQS